MSLVFDFNFIPQKANPLFYFYILFYLAILHHYISFSSYISIYFIYLFYFFKYFSSQTIALYNAKEFLLKLTENKQEKYLFTACN